MAMANGGKIYERSITMVDYFRMCVDFSYYNEFMSTIKFDLI